MAQIHYQRHNNDYRPHMAELCKLSWDEKKAAQWRGLSCPKRFSDVNCALSGWCN
jgi:hypothetical protein